MYNMWLVFLVTSTLWVMFSAGSNILELFPEYKAELDQLRSGMQSMNTELHNIKSELGKTKNVLTSQQKKIESRLKTVEAGALRVVACEDKAPIHIACPNRIEIIKANYGRKEGRNVCPSKHMRSTNCFSRTSERKIRGLCHGKRICRLNPTNREFGDACRGTHKYVDVTYKCK